MGLFTKRGADLDLTILQKKGIIKVPEIVKPDYTITKDGVIDFTNVKSNSNSSYPSSTSSTSSTASQSSSSPDMGFLAGLAGAASSSDSSVSNNSSNPLASFDSYNPESSSSSLSSSSQSSYNSTNNSSDSDREKLLQITMLQEKLDNLEFKFEQLLERLSSMESKIR